MSGQAYLFDLHDIVDNIRDDLEECGELIRLPFSGDEVTFEDFLDKLEGDPKNSITLKDSDKLDDLLYDLAKEYVFQRLMSRYKTIPSSYQSLYLDLLDRLFVSPPNRDYGVDTAVAIGDNALQYAEIYVDRILNIMPANEWLMLDYDVVGSSVIVRTGEDFRIYYFNAMVGDKRWEGDLIPAGSSVSILNGKSQREISDETILMTCAMATGGRSKRSGSRLKLTARSAVRELTGG